MFMADLTICSRVSGCNLITHNEITLVYIKTTNVMCSVGELA